MVNGRGMFVGSVGRRRAGAATAVSVALLAPLAAPVAAAPSATVKSYSQHRDFQDAVVEDVNQFWAREFRRFDAKYRRPLVRTIDRGRYNGTKCGKVIADPAEATGFSDVSPAFYCRKDRSMNVSAGWMFRAMQKPFGEGGVALVIAHEFSHHVQHSLGVLRGQSRALELAADCLAGVWMGSAVGDGLINRGDLDEARKALRSLGDRGTTSVSHGRASQRAKAFNAGVKHTSASRC
ncbi:MAG: neutral zinc metallopeptidase [Sporichthyaceae bacterium]